MTASTPIPVQASECDPRTADCRPPGQQQYTGTDINPTITVTVATPLPDPAPSMPPSLSLPGGITTTLQSGSTPSFQYLVNTPTTHVCGNGDATAGTSSQAIPFCAFPDITLGCLPSLSNQPGGGYDTSVSAGYSFDTGTYTADIASSDIYITGGTCPGAFQSPNAGPRDYEVYFPYGATSLPNAQYSIATTDPASWANTFTQLPLNDAVGNQNNCYGTLGCIIILRTHNGGTVAIDATRVNAGSDGTGTGGTYLGNWFTATYSIAQNGSFQH